MVRVTLKGIMEKISMPIESKKEGAEAFQVMTVRVPGAKNEFGEVVADDVVYEAIVGKGLNPADVSFMQNGNVSVTCKLIPKQVPYQDKFIQNLSLVAVALEAISAAERAADKKK